LQRPFKDVLRQYFASPDVNVSPHQQAFTDAVLGQYFAASDVDLSPKQVLDLVRDHTDEIRRATLVSYTVSSDEMRSVWGLEATLRFGDHTPETVRGEGNGTISAFVAALEQWTGVDIKVRDYAQQTLSEGTGARAISYVLAIVDGEPVLGVDEHTDTVTANFHAILAAVSRVPHAWDNLSSSSVSTG
jgi:hypothetical protein